MNNQPGMVHQEPGTAADSNTVDSNAAKSETTTTTTTNKTAMNKKSCTDANGKVILKGHTGYTACLKYKKAQMGGIADDSLNDTSSSSYNNK